MLKRDAKAAKQELVRAQDELERITAGNRRSKDEVENRRIMFRFGHFPQRATRNTSTTCGATSPRLKDKLRFRYCNLIPNA